VEGTDGIVADTSRIEELRRRVQRDPASIAFAQLAEEYRRAGRYKEAIETCEQGLAHHPGYLSARVTLGRSYLETNELEAAQVELKQVLRAAPENLAALRGLAEIHHRRGELQEALAHYRTALEFARNDPELQHLVEQIAKELQPQPAAPVVLDGLSFEDVKNTFLNLSLPETMPGDDGVAADAVAADAAPPAPVTALSQPTPDEAFPWPVHDVPALAAGEEPAADTAPGHNVADPGETPVDTVEDRPAGQAAPVASDEPLPVAEEEPLPVAEEETAAVMQSTADEPVGPAAEHSAVVEALSAAVPEDLSAVHSDANPRVDALERWLETIIADRQGRA
jgi:cellulose synthase operon protein C